MSLTNSDNKTASPSEEGKKAVSQVSETSIPHEHEHGCCCHQHEHNDAKKSCGCAHYEEDHCGCEHEDLEEDHQCCCGP